LLGLHIELARLWVTVEAQIHGWDFYPSQESITRRTFIRNGLYRYIRYPIYAGELLVILAWPFEYGAPITLLLAIAISFAVINSRIRREEADMMAEYGDTYAAYVQITDRMIPNLW